MDSPLAQTWPSARETIECWDDDEDLQINDDIQFRATSSAGSISNSSVRPSGHRDSISSRRSGRSELESNVGDEDWQILLPDNDETPKEEVLASATHAGIPIPADVPRSALLGGTIKRLAERKPKRTFVDDWSDDVELPGPDTVLELKIPRDASFPESIRQINSAATSPVKTTAPLLWNEDTSTRLGSALATLRGIQDENDAPFDQSIPTLKAPAPTPTPTSLQRSSLHTVEGCIDDYGQDLELPPGDRPLQLSCRQKERRVSSPALENFDIEWSEGSIGVRVGGTTRDGRSLPSSSISIASPSVSSCITGESEEDGLDGLVFPDGPLDFSTSLKKRQEGQAIGEFSEQNEARSTSNTQDADDFFSDLEVDNGRVFASGKLTLNSNVKRKTELPMSPTHRSETTLRFTNGAGSPRTRIPRLSGHERTHSTSLETVSESGAPIFKFERSQSRLGHASQSSVSSVPSTGALTISPTPSASGRKPLTSRPSRDISSSGASKQPNRHLRTKRSLPAIRGGIGTGAVAQSLQRPPTISRGPARSSVNRPKTPVERTAIDGGLLDHRAQASFIPGAPSEREPRHTSASCLRPSRRANSDSSGNLFSPRDTFARLSRSTHPDHHRLSLGGTGTETPSGPAKRPLTRATRRRNFGDGTELASFDDLPTSAASESRFIKTPSSRGAPKSLRTRVSQSRGSPPAPSPTQSSTPPSTSKLNPTPRFARDTNASRNAREQRIASLNLKSRESNSLFSSNSNWKPQPIPRMSPSSVPLRNRKTRSANKGPSKPHLIKPMGTGVQEAKSVNGMRYNPATFRWEGNENLVHDFELATFSKSPKPAPALIANVGCMQNVQAVGGMIFDPHRMCWLKATSVNSGRQGGVAPEDEDDVFAGLDDLEDRVTGISGRTTGSLDNFNAHAAGDDPSADESSDDGPITEEFDVGPEFIRRQRAEEEKWRRKVDKWVGVGRGDHEPHSRWAIRDLVGSEGEGL